MPKTTLVKVSSRGLVTLPEKIRSEPGIHDGDYLAISSDKDPIVEKKVRAVVNYENPDDVWKEHTKKRLNRD